MHILWGSLMAAVGVFMFVCGRLKSEFVIYRLMVARSKVLWGKNVHKFHQTAGPMIIVFGILLALGYIPMK
jgi:hypothetical protein